MYAPNRPDFTMRPSNRFSKLIFHLVVLSGLGLTASHSQSIAQTIPWQSDLETAISMAEKGNKLVLIHFMAEWSRDEQELKKLVFSDPHVQRAIASYVIPVQIDVDEQPDLATKYGIQAVPCDLIITPAKRIVARRPSPKEAANYATMVGRLESTLKQISLKGADVFNHHLLDSEALAPDVTPSPPRFELTQNNPSNRGFSSTESTTFMPNPTLEAPRNADASNTDFAAPVLTPDNDLAASEEPQAKLGPLKIINDKFFSPGPTERPQGLTETAMQPNLQRPPLSPAHQAVAFEPNSAPNFQPNPAAIFQPNPTASAAEFREDPRAADFHARNFHVQNVGENKIPDELAVAPQPPQQAEPKFELKSQPQPHFPTQLQPQSEPALAMKGKCPVTLIQEGHWAEGNADWGCVHRGRLYLFATEQHRSTFLADPDTYSPLLAGHDPVIYEQSAKLVPGNEAHGVFMGEAPNLRVVLFSSQESRKLFEENPRKYIETIRVAMERSGGSSTMIR